MAKLKDIISFKGTFTLWHIFWSTLEAPQNFEEMLEDFISEKIISEAFFSNFIWTISHNVNDGHPGISRTNLWIPKKEWTLFADLFYWSGKKFVLTDPIVFVNRIMEYFDTKTYAIAMARSRSHILNLSAYEYFNSVVEQLLEMENEIGVRYDNIEKSDLNFQGNPLYFVDNNINSRPYIIGENFIWRLLLLCSKTDYIKEEQFNGYRLPKRFTIKRLPNSDERRDSYELAIENHVYRAYPYKKNVSFESFIKQCCCCAILPELDLKFEYQANTK